jgi:two-component system chemotaxis response regulator CheB
VTALPDRISSGTGPQVTRVSCPDCSGVISVEAEGHRGHLRLSCRVGHRFSLPDLLAAKEDRLEGRLWEALHSLVEMAELLEDLIAYAERQELDTVARSFHDRAARAREQAGLLRRIIEENLALELSDDAGRIHGDGAS